MVTFFCQRASKMDLMDASYIGYLVICGIIGIVGNAIIIRVIQKKKPKLSTDILIIALAAVDLISSALLIPVITWSISLDFRTRFNCVFFWYFRRTFACESALLASIIAIDRYIMVCSPCKLTTSKRKAMVCVVLSNGFCLFICLQFVYGNAVGVGESIVWAYNGPDWLQFAFGMILNFIYLMACVSCSFCYSMIYRKIKKHNDNTAYMQSAINSGSAVSSKDAENSGSAPVEVETANVGTDNSQGRGHAVGNGDQSDLQECLSEPVESNHAPPPRMAFSDNAQPIPAISSAVHNKESSNKQVLDHCRQEPPCCKESGVTSSKSNKWCYIGTSSHL